MSAVVPVMPSGWWLRSSCGEDCGICGAFVPQGYCLGLPRPSNANNSTRVDIDEWNCLSCIMYDIRHREHRDHKQHGRAAT